MPSNKFINALKAEGGCGIFLYAILASFICLAIYAAIVQVSGRGPKVETMNRFAKECFNRKEIDSGRFSMDMSESERAQMVDECTAEYENYLLNFGNSGRHN